MSSRYPSSPPLGQREDGRFRVSSPERTKRQGLSLEMERGRAERLPLLRCKFRVGLLRTSPALGLGHGVASMKQACRREVQVSLATQ